LDDVGELLDGESGLAECVFEVLVRHRHVLRAGAGKLRLAGSLSKSSQLVPGRLRGRPEMSLRCPARLRIVFVMAAMATQTYPRPAAGSGLTRDQVMTASEVAELLQLPVSTVYYLARRGELPASRLGRAWRFLRPRIEELLGA
jgi:excisionase family DNA binding protein